MKPKFPLSLLLCVLLVGCAQDSLTYVCVNEEPTFDIEQVSSLEDSMGLARGHDAVILDYDATNLPEGGTWRVSSVDLLLLIPASQFDYYPTNIRLSVEVFDGINPTTTQPWVVVQTVDTSTLEWSDVWLSSPNHALDREQRQAWWRFDFNSVIPEAGMQSTSFVVGAAWSASNLPTIGYSNYNRPCKRNWTKYDDATGWVLNSERGMVGVTNPNACNWPMLRVNVEERHEAESCFN